MKAQISLRSMRVSAPKEMKQEWKFSFTVGYGHWAVQWSSGGKCKNMSIIPWEAIFDITIDDYIRFYHEQITKGYLTEENYKFESGDIHINLLIWTKNQWLYVKDRLSRQERLLCISWEHPYTFLCGYLSILESGFYSQNQIDFLTEYFDPEWAGKGGIVDDQAFFDAWIPGQMRVYSGYWRYFMRRLVDHLIGAGYLIIQSPKIMSNSLFIMENAPSKDIESLLKREMESFISSQLRIGLCKPAPKQIVKQIHENMPPRIKEWLSRKKA